MINPIRYVIYGDRTPIPAPTTPDPSMAKLKRAVAELEDSRHEVELALSDVRETLAGLQIRFDALLEAGNGAMEKKECPEKGVKETATDSTAPIWPKSTCVVTLHAFNGRLATADCLSPAPNTTPGHSSPAIHVPFNQTTAHAWEKFLKLSYPDGRVAFRSEKTKGYLSVDADSDEQWLVLLPPADPVRALTERELFHCVSLSEMVDEKQIAKGCPLLGATSAERDAKRRELKAAGAGWVAIRGYNGRYVSCENGRQPGATCNRRAHRMWEYFQVQQAGEVEGEKQ